MSIETNKLTMHCFTEFINTASEKLARELISPRNLPCSGTLRGDAGACWLSRCHWDHARGLPGHPMDTRGDDCRRRQGSCTLHHAGNAPRQLLWCSTNRGKDRGNGDEFLSPIRRTIRRRTWAT